MREVREGARCLSTAQKKIYDNWAETLFGLIQGST
jgi:hypothetical protein